MKRVQFLLCLHMPVIFPSSRCAPGERANAQLKTWNILRKLRCCPWRAGQLAKAIHVLQIREANAG